MRTWLWRPLIRRKRLIAFLEEQENRMTNETVAFVFHQLRRNLEVGQTLVISPEAAVRAFDKEQT